MRPAPETTDQNGNPLHLLCENTSFLVLLRGGRNQAISFENYWPFPLGEHKAKVLPCLRPWKMDGNAC
jgi:hypothetical protein